MAADELTEPRPLGIDWSDPDNAPLSRAEHVAMVRETLETARRLRAEHESGPDYYCTLCRERGVIIPPGMCPVRLQATRIVLELRRDLRRLGVRPR